MTIEFTVFGKPAPAGSKRGFLVKGRVIITDANKNAKPWKALVSDAAIGAMVNGRVHELLRGPLVLEATFYFPRPKGHFRVRRGEPTGELREGVPLYPTGRPDTTKLLRALEDACTGIVWKDDAQVVNQWVRKMYGEPARCEVRVEELNEA